MRWSLAPRWRKVLRDLSENPIRALLAILAMTAGCFGIGSILTSYSILHRELAKTHDATRPASAFLDVTGLTGDAIEAVRRLPGVKDAEARPLLSGRIRVGEDEWRPLAVFVISDFHNLRLDTFESDRGAWPPGEDEMLLERSSMSVAQAVAGDLVTVRIGDGAEQSIRVGGTVHAAGLAPGWMDHHVSAFVGSQSRLRSMSQTNASTETSRLMIAVAERRLDEAHIREVAQGIRAFLTASGTTVSRIEIPPPGRHPHADQMDTFLLLLGAFAMLTVALGAVLVANMIHGLLFAEVRHVGVMKTIGATTGQLVALYLGQVSVLSLISLVLGMPLGYAAGRAYADFAGESILNATMASHAVPPSAIAAQVAIGLLLPLLVAAAPVVSASRITIREAFSGDPASRPFGSRRLDRFLVRSLERVSFIERPLALSLRATFQRRGRLVLTVGTLAAGGAVFITTQNVAVAWTHAIDADAEARRYDVGARLARDYPRASLDQALQSVPDVARAEYWVEASAGLAAIHRDAPRPVRLSHGVDDDRIRLIGPDIPSPLLALPLISGRWLTAIDRDAVVINQAVRARQPSLSVGGRLNLRVDERDLSLAIVGIVKELAPVPIAYAPARTVLEATGRPEGFSRSIRVVTRQRDPESLARASREIERALEKAGIRVRGLQTLADSRRSFEDHLVIINTALFLAAALVVLVGALGLTSTMMLNVVERTREIGIQGSIGATPKTISRHVLFEGWLLGILSWCAATVIAIPVTWALDRAAGQMFIKSSLDFVMSFRAVGAWLVFVSVVAAVSSFYPARRAARLAIRDALVYG